MSYRRIQSQPTYTLERALPRGRGNKAEAAKLHLKKPYILTLQIASSKTP